MGIGHRHETGTANEDPCRDAYISRDNQRWEPSMDRAIQGTEPGTVRVEVTLLWLLSVPISTGAAQYALVLERVDGRENTYRTVGLLWLVRKEAETLEATFKNLESKQTIILI
jgi:hypothetical protein